jgi:hypothetical protein
LRAENRVGIPADIAQQQFVVAEEVLARIFPNAAAATEGANWLSSFRFLAERTRNENDWRRT